MPSLAKLEDCKMVAFCDIVIEKAVKGGAEPLTTPEQAYCVTRILEGIYESGKTGKPYYFD